MSGVYLFFRPVRKHVSRPENGRSQTDRRKGVVGRGQRFEDGGHEYNEGKQHKNATYAHSTFKLLFNVWGMKNAPIVQFDRMTISNVTISIRVNAHHIF